MITNGLKFLMPLLLMVCLAAAAAGDNTPPEPAQPGIETLLSEGTDAKDADNSGAAGDEAAAAPIDLSVIPARLDINDILNADKGLEGFMKKLSDLEKMGSGKVTVYHIGDSHVSEGSFPQAVAGGLQDTFGDSGGYVFSYPKTNSGSPELKKQEKVRKKDRKKSAARKKKKQNLRRGYPVTGKPEMRQVSGPETDAGVLYYTHGLPGKTFGYFAGYTLLREHISTWKPDLVIVTLGTNDAVSALFDRDLFAAEVDALASMVRTAAPEASILFTTPPDAYRKNGRNNENIPIIRELLLSYAENKGYACWDLYEIMGGKSSMRHWFISGLAEKDRVHFTKSGYQAIGELLSQALADSYEHKLMSTRPEAKQPSWN